MLSFIIIFFLILIFLTADPASPPDNVDAMVLSSSEIMVTWDEVPQIDQNGIITTYEVLYEPQEIQGEEIMSPVMVNTTNLSIILIDLEPVVIYNISARAYTSVGPGPFSEEITRRTLVDGK